jgi:hypothetical protein
MASYKIFLATANRDPDSINSPYTKPYVLCSNVERGAAIITYHVFVGPFMVIVKMLNIDHDTSFNSMEVPLAKGGFGSIVALYDGH